MNFYIADMHMGHQNVLRFDNRPFASVEEMDKLLVGYWNMRVMVEDHVYIVGDFCYKSAQAYFESIDKILRINDNGRGVVLCHFPIADWEARHHGSYHIYGHIHGNDVECMRFLRHRGPAYNAAACINNYQPGKLEEIIRNNEIYLNVQEN